MNREDIDRLWSKALRQSIENGEQFTRYDFAALVAAAEREACAQLADDPGEPIGQKIAVAIRARGQI